MSSESSNNTTPSVSLSCVAGGVNPLYKCFSWSGRAESANAIFYACGRSIVVNDTTELKNHLTLSHHTDRVNFVKSINNFTDRQLLVSGGSDNRLVIWEAPSTLVFSKESWRVKAEISLDHSVSFATVCEFQENLTYVIVGSIMGDMYLFRLSDESASAPAPLVLLDNIRFGHHFTQECAVAFQVTPTHLALFLGGLDFTVHVYTIDTRKESVANTAEKGSIFEYKTSLKGHENAITDLQVHAGSAGSLSAAGSGTGKRTPEWIVASSSKDSYIRLWRFAELLDVVESDVKKQISEFQSKQTMVFSIEGKNYFVSLESVLAAHAESVVSLQWGTYNKQVALLSASFDFNIILWTKDEETGIWLSSYRLGQVCGSKFAFFQAAFNLDCTSILSYTYTGSFYLWSHNDSKQIWESKPTVTGHFNQVFDLDWSSKGDFLVSCGLDQTTRMYVQSAARPSNWHEVSRAQIHGYDINSVKCLPVNLDGKNVCDTLLCGADEKVVRLFEPPAAFVNAVNQIGDRNLRLFFERDEDESKYLEVNDNGVKEYLVSREGGAQVLGLMIKAVRTEAEFDPSKYIDPEDEGGLIQDKMQLIEDKKKEEELFSQKHDFRVAPIEDYLLKHTLWPELNKLYGHGYELKCVGCSHDGKMIVTCSKSQTKENASVLFWNPSNYQIIGKLEFHNFTINQFEFSPRDTFFATVSKDRSLAVYSRIPDDAATTSDAPPKVPYELAYSDKSHTRIIHSLSFSSDEKFLVTGARDKRIKIHSLSGSTAAEKKVVLTKLLASPITAVAFAPSANDGTTNTKYILVVGYEEGKLEVYTFDETKNDLELIGEPHKFEAHTDSITKIKFRPTATVTPLTVLQFASSSLDHTLRVFNITPSSPAVVV